MCGSLLECARQDCLHELARERFEFLLGGDMAVRDTDRLDGVLEWLQTTLLSVRLVGPQQSSAIEGYL